MHPAGVASYDPLALRLADAPIPRAYACQQDASAPRLDNGMRALAAPILSLAEPRSQPYRHMIFNLSIPTPHRGQRMPSVTSSCSSMTRRFDRQCGQRVTTWWQGVLNCWVRIVTPLRFGFTRARPLRRHATTVLLARPRNRCWATPTACISAARFEFLRGIDVRAAVGDCTRAQMRTGWWHTCAADPEKRTKCCVGMMCLDKRAPVEKPGPSVVRDLLRTSTASYF